jgi:hypothetical protein
MRPRPHRLFRARPARVAVASVDARIAPALEALERIKNDVQAGRSSCTLCGRRSVMVGVWHPTREYQDKLGCPPGKIRMAVYTLCSDHARQPHSVVMPRVERHMLATAAVACGNPEAN